MEIVHTIKDLQAALAALRAQGKTVGLVPTMGALHAGHASLVKRCVAENDAAVVSVLLIPRSLTTRTTWQSIRVRWMPIAVCWSSVAQPLPLLPLWKRCILNPIHVSSAMPRWIR